MKKNSILSIIVLFITAIVWGLAFPFQNMVPEEISAFWFNGIRFIIGAISLVPVVLVFERKKASKAEWKKTLIAGAICGTILFAASALQQIGIQMTNSSAKAAFITGLYMILVPFAGIFLGKKVRPEAWLGAATGVAGLYFVCFSGGIENAHIGDLVVFIGALFWTAHILCIDMLASECPPLKFSLVQFIFCGILNLVVAPLLSGPLNVSPEVFSAAVIPILYCGIFSVGVAYTCQVIGQRGTEPALASIILCCESIFAAIGEPIIDKSATPLPLLGYMGCALIFVGILLSQSKIFKKSA